MLSLTYFVFDFFTLPI